MNELHTLLADSVEKVLQKAEGAEFADAWKLIAEAGLTATLISEESGGFGGGMAGALIVLRACGYHATPTPLADAVLGAAVLDAAGLDIPDGPFALVSNFKGEVRDGRFSGEAMHVPFGRDLSYVVGVLDSGEAVLVSRDQATDVEEQVNLAYEPRDRLVFKGAAAQAGLAKGWTAASVYDALALARAAQIGGALQAALELSANYVRERKQFGKPLSSLQAIQQQIALMAEHTAATDMAAAAAARDWTGEAGIFPVAAAKLRANQAAELGVTVSQQVHGAIGFTKEYALNRFTLRLMAWRAEYGSDRRWALQLGRQVAGWGADAFWGRLVQPV